MNNATILSLARRYALAYMHVYGHALVASDMETLENFADTVGQSSVQFYLQLAAWADDEKKAALYAVADDKHVPASIKQIIALLVIDKRASLCADVSRAIVRLWYERHGIEHFVVSSSYQLSDAQRQVVMQLVNTQLPGTHRFTFTHVTDLIAGIRIASREYGWEHSVARQLRKARQYMV